MPVIYLDAGESATDALFGRADHSAMRYMEESFQRYVSKTRMNRSDLDYIIQRHEMVNSREALETVDAMRRKLSSVWKTDSIRTLRSINELQTAPKTMQRWVMAHESLRRFYLDGGCNGYSDDYVDTDKSVGENHYLWRRVYSGVAKVTPEGPVTKEYIEPIRDEKDLLMAGERAAIISTHHILSMTLQESRIDPTSTFNEMLS